MKKTLSARPIIAAVLCVCFATTLHAAPGAGYVTDVAESRLLKVDLNTGNSHVVGSFVNVDNIGGLAYDSSSGTLYGVSPSADALYSLDLDTGEASFVGAFGIGSVTMQGAAYDRNRDALFAVESVLQQLYTIDRNTGHAQLVGSTGIGLSGLAISPLTGALYGTLCAQCGDLHGLYLINKDTGATTPVGSDVNTRYNGLAFDIDGTLYGVRNDADSLYRINIDTGSPTLVGQLNVAGVNPLGFEIIAVPEPTTLTMMIAAATFWLFCAPGRERRAGNRP